MPDPPKSGAVAFREVLPKKGLLFTENHAHLVLCKPKLLPLKSVTLEKMEQMQKDAKLKVQDQVQKEQEMEEQAQGQGQVVSESISFE